MEVLAVKASDGTVRTAFNKGKGGMEWSSALYGKHEKSFILILILMA